MSTPSSIKQRQLKHLNSQFMQLHSNLSDLESLLKITKLQADSIRKIGLIHGSLFMSSHKVFYDQETSMEETTVNNYERPTEKMDIDGDEDDDIIYNDSSSFVIPEDENFKG